MDHEIQPLHMAQDFPVAVGAVGAAGAVGARMVGMVGVGNRLLETALAGANNDFREVRPGRVQEKMRQSHRGLKPWMCQILSNSHGLMKTEGCETTPKYNG